MAKFFLEIVFSEDKIANLPFKRFDNDGFEFIDQDLPAGEWRSNENPLKTILEVLSVKHPISDQIPHWMMEEKMFFLNTSDNPNRRSRERGYTTDLNNETTIDDIKIHIKKPYEKVNYDIGGGRRRTKRKRKRTKRRKSKRKMKRKRTKRKIKRKRRKRRR